jgi:hypothetical protein
MPLVFTGGMTTNTRFQVVEDKPVLHRSDAQGVRVVRVQTILDTETQQRTEVKFWADWSNPTNILHIS